VLLFLVFVVENSKKTNIRFIVPEVIAPLWVGLLAAAFLGALAGGLAVHLLGDRQQGQRRGRRHDRDAPPAT
jgi:uncharacterized integral membrane protein